MKELIIGTLIVLISTLIIYTVREVYKKIRANLIRKRNQEYMNEILKNLKW